MIRLRTTTRPGVPLHVVLAAAFAACGHGQRLDEVQPPELLVEVLPRGARVSLDGRPIGDGSRTLRAPPAGEHVLAVEAEGYETFERALPEGDLAGVRVAAALRPSGFGSSRPLDYDEAEGLALAAAFLLRAGAPRDAADYAERAIALEPGRALPHRVLGDAFAGKGDLRRAVAGWAEYLRLSPEAPDARAVARRIEEARGDVTIK